MDRTWIAPVPAQGMALHSLVVIGCGDDLELRLSGEGWPPLEIPLRGAQVHTDGEVTLRTSRVDDVNLALEYTSANGLNLTRARLRWDDSCFGGTGIREELEALFTAPRGTKRPHRFDFCVDVVLSLTTRG
ncbi:hypothetical protein AB0M72_17570 [Nocardiopsis dassonvillei]